jgi:hypothetical protein
MILFLMIAVAGKKTVPPKCLLKEAFAAVNF